MNKKSLLYILAFSLLLTSVEVFAQSKKSKSKSKTTATSPKSEMDIFLDDLMAKMSLDEKIGQLNLLTPGGTVTGAYVSADVDNKVRSGQVGGMFGIRGAEKIRKAQEIAVNSSRLGIPMIFGLDVIHGHNTIFPIPLGLSCSWDIKMIEQSARAAAEEATAEGISWVYSPMVDITRDPRWGRVAEGAGEDAFLGSAIAAAMVRGYQGNDLSANNTAMACVKHFALYGASEAGRDYNTVDMSRVRMFNEYLPPFKAAFDAGCGSVMASFNEVDGIPATANKWLMTDLLREQWKFNGFVVTDYTGIVEMVDHGYGNITEVSAKSLKAGVDMDMVSEGFYQHLKQALDKGLVTEADINTACRRVLEAKYKLGLFKDPYRYCDKNRARNNFTPATRAVARDFANRSAVLLKNENEVLPLKKGSSIALIGPLAKNNINMLGTWSVSGDFSDNVTVFSGLKSVVNGQSSINYAQGANISDDPEFAKKVNAFMEEITIGNPDALLAEAINVANESDVIVLVLGESANMSGEASSMSNIDLQPSQKRLLREMKKIGKPVIVVLMNGRPMTIEEDLPYMDALLEVWFAGSEAGNSVADLLFGHMNPSGKLTMTWPRNVGQIPIHYNYKNTGRPFDPNNPTQKFKSQYLDVDNTPLYPFGYGLSYTKFEYSDVTLSANKMSATGKITAKVTVKNTGKYDGSEVVQLYIRDHVGSITRPVKELKGFQKVEIKKGESKEITFEISEELLKFYNSDLVYASEPGLFSVFIGTNSDTQNKQEFELTK